MDLGLQNLSDDDLFALLQEACVELGRRDPAIQELSQKAILTESEKVVAMREAMKEGAQKLKDEFINQIQEETLKELRKAVKAGTFKPLGVKEETTAIVEAERAGRQQLRDEADKAINAEIPRLWVQVQGLTITVSYFVQSGQRNTSSNNGVNRSKVKAFVAALEDALGLPRTVNTQYPHGEPTVGGTGTRPSF